MRDSELVIFSEDTRLAVVPNGELTRPVKKDEPFVLLPPNEQDYFAITSGLLGVRSLGPPDKGNTLYYQMPPFEEALRIVEAQLEELESGGSEKDSLPLEEKLRSQLRLVEIGRQPKAKGPGRYSIRDTLTVVEGPIKTQAWALEVRATTEEERLKAKALSNRVINFDFFAVPANNSATTDIKSK